jgi:hypothetical protein
MSTTKEIQAAIPTRYVLLGYVPAVVTSVLYTASTNRLG